MISSAVIGCPLVAPRANERCARQHRLRTLHRRIIFSEAVSDWRPRTIYDCSNDNAHVRAHALKMHDFSHPRITYLIGDCASSKIVQRIENEAKQVTGPVMVVLDSDHSAQHVSKEIQAYHRLVTPGSYLHVQDGVIDTQPRFAKERPGPLVAIEAFLAQNNDFELDTARSERFLITHHPKGWLKRKPAEKTARR